MSNNQAYDGLAIAESLYSFDGEETNSSLANPDDSFNRELAHDIHIINELLHCMTAGMPTYKRVCNGLLAIHGKAFKSPLSSEVNRA